MTAAKRQSTGTTTKRSVGRYWIGLALMVGMAAMVAVVTASQPEPPKNGDDEATLSEKLGGRERYLTHVSTDKPMYRPGEKVRVRGVLLHAHDRTPIGKDIERPARIKINGPKGDTVAQGSARIKNSTLGFAWAVPEDQAGGQYIVKVTHPFTGHPPAERNFDVRQYRSPSLKTQIEFVKKAYGPGETVTATVSIQKAEGGVPGEATIEAVARVDGKEVHRGKVDMNQQGHATARFQLPDTIERGQGTLAFVIDRGGQVQTATKTIPIVLQTLDLSMYPEGGDLVAGLKSRVYVQAWTPYGDPADFEAKVVNRAGDTVAEVSTIHEGRGVFTITPRADEAYTLKVTKPAGIKTSYGLPTVREQGAVLRATRNQYPADRPITLRVASTLPDTALNITLAKREKVVSQYIMPAKKQEEEPRAKKITLTPPGNASGVLRATVTTAEGKPLAERLIYRKPAKQINIDLEPNQSTYVPGDPVELTVTTTNANGEPIPAMVGLTVTDDSVLELIDKRDQAPHLPAMAMLEPHVNDLSDSHVYLSDKQTVEGVKPAKALDLLLGTQGWRRFAFVDPDKFVKKHKDKAKRVLALKEERRVDFMTRSFGAAARNGAEGVPRAAQAEDQQAAAPEEKNAEADAEPAAENDAEAQNAANREPDRQQPAEQQGQRADEAGELEDELLERQRDMSRARRPGDDLIAVRQYAHEAPEAPKDQPPRTRTDFTETVFWNAGVKTSEKTGKATVEFQLSDLITGFRVHANAFDRRGALGHDSALIESIEPFYVEPKMPLELTQGDRVKLPVTMVNSTNSALPQVSFSAKASDGLALEGFGVDEGDKLSLNANERQRKLVDVDTSGFSGEASFTFAGRASAFRDTVEKSVMVQPRGFPAEIAHSGMLRADSQIKHGFHMPDDMVEGSLEAEINVHPTPLSNMTEALERLIKEPHGCFEQTSSTVYPLAMAQQYFTTHAGVDPALVARSKKQLDKGYKRLVGFECPERGYEWFGKDPMHPGLTAYGLMEFADLKQVRDVDEQMMQRTRQRLLNVRDGEGNFKLADDALHGWVPDQKLSNAYIAWTLLETGMKPAEIETEIAYVLEAAPKSENTYVLALAANIARLAGRNDEAMSLMDKLRKRQNDSGLVTGGSGTIVGSRGRSLKIETTALATLAWLRDEAYTGPAKQSIDWLARQCKDGRYGSTQSTVLALQAIVRYDKQRAKPNKPGKLQLVVDGEKVGDPVAFDKETTGTIELPDISDRLAAGNHTIAINMIDGARMPYSMNVKFNRLKPDSSDQCPLRLDVALNDNSIPEGNVTEADVTVKHVGNKEASMPTAIVGVPGGLEVRHDQLKELVKSGKIAAYEVLGREVVLYWRSMKPDAEVTVPLSFVAAIPGQFTAPASRAYLYYGDEHKQWVPGLNIEVTAKE